MKKLCVIDIGTHKAEEVRLFEGKPNWTVRNRLRILRQAGKNPRAARRQMAGIDELSKEFKAACHCRYVLVEPILHPALMRFVSAVPSILVGGVSSCVPSGRAELLLAKDSLGNSLIPTKPGLTGVTLETFNVEFPRLYEFAASTFVGSGECSDIVVRMNAEGVEGPIIDFLANKGSVKPAVIAGSIGDIRKCFGQTEYDKALKTMSDANIPFVYLTSHPRSWASGLEQILAAVRGN